MEGFRFPSSIRGCWILSRFVVLTTFVSQLRKANVGDARPTELLKSLGINLCKGYRSLLKIDLLSEKYINSDLSLSS
jgi:hypothetical protein